MRLEFDLNNNIEKPEIVLGKRNYDKIGSIVNFDNLSYDYNLMSADSIKFTVYKELNYEKERLWDEIKERRLIWLKEFNEWFQIDVVINDENGITKEVTGTSLCEAELGQVLLKSTEINTEDDIAREEYINPTVFYKPSNPNESLLHRLLKEVPNYSIKYVDESLWNIQRTFSIDGTSIYDELTGEIAEEIGCLFLFDSTDRSISVYDLKTNCNHCGHRAEYTDICPECGSTDLNYGYGNDTTIFVDSETLAENISLSGKQDEVKNYIKVCGGDDVIDAAIAACNPTGTQYIYAFSDRDREDMSESLVSKLNEYSNEYESLTPTYQAIMKEVYDAIDEQLKLESTMMPDIKTAETNAQKELAKLTPAKLSPIAVQDVSIASVYTVNNAVLGMAKCIVNSTVFKIEIIDNSATYSGQVWRGKFKIINRSDENDVAENTGHIEIVINDDYAYYVEQKIKKIIDRDDVHLVDMFDKKTTLNTFKSELKKYCLSRLNSFESAYQSIIDVLIETNCANDSTYGDIYNDLYLPYYNKLIAIQEEIGVRVSEIETVDEKLEELEKSRTEITNQLNLKNYLGDELWKELCSFRREDSYENSNYISDGLDNSEILAKAQELFNKAKKETITASTLQMSLSTTMFNLLAIPEFKKLTGMFEGGNWIRVGLDDKIYRLRLVHYKIDFSQIQNIEVEFSDVTQTANGLNDTKSLMDKVTSMATNFSYVAHQAEQGSKSFTELDKIRNDGLNAALYNICNSVNQDFIIDEHGITGRKWDDILGDYSPEQVKMNNNILCYTSDRWQTVKSALGKIEYYNPILKEKVSQYGVICDAVISGTLMSNDIIGGHIYSENYSYISGTHIDLNTGDFTFAGGKLVYDSKKDTLNLTGTITFEGIDYSNAEAKKELQDSLGITDVQNDIDEFNNASILTPLEKKNMLDNWTSIQSEYQKNIELAKAFDVSNNSIVIAYTNAYNTLANQISKCGLNNLTTSTTIDTRIYNDINNYYAANVDFANLINKEAKRLSEQTLIDAKAYSNEEITKLSTSINKEISDLNTELTDTQSYLDGAFKDGIVDEIELSKINQLIKQIELEKLDVDKQYISIYNNSFINDDTKVSLKNAYDNYDNAHASLINSINSAITILNSTSDQSQKQVSIDNVNSSFDTYKEKITKIYETLNYAIDEISTLKVSDLRYSVNKDIEEVNTLIDDTQTYIDGAFKDGIIDDIELAKITQLIKQLELEVSDIDKEYDAIYNNSFLSSATKNNLKNIYSIYDNAHTLLTDSINNAISVLNSTATQSQKQSAVSSVDSAFNTYKDSVIEIHNILNSAIDEVSTLKISQLRNDVNKDISDVNTLISDTKTYIDGAFHDKVIDESESVSISQLLYRLDTEKVDLDARYNSIYNNLSISAASKNNLKSAKENYDNSHTSLKTLINTAVSVVQDTTKTDNQKQTAINNMNKGFTDYNSKISALSTAFESAIDSIGTNKLDAFVNGDYKNFVSDIQTQVDGKSETYYTPTQPYENHLNVSKNSDYDKLVGDLWYDSDESVKKTYIYTRTANGNNYDYKWMEMEVPAEVFDMADGKAQIFTSKPSNYNVNDLWLIGSDYTPSISGVKVGYVLVAKKNNAGYTESDWVLSIKYTDDSALQTFINETYTKKINYLETQDDKKAETWYQASNPVGTSAWTENGKSNASHKGDIWYNTTDQKTYIYDGSSWKLTTTTPPDEVFDKIDGKAQIFVSTPTTPYHIGDLWFNSSTSDILTCVTERLTGNYNTSDWEKRNKYTDDVSVQKWVNDTYKERVNTLETQMDGKVETYYQASDPSTSWSTSEKTIHNGDLWYDTSKKRSYIYNGTSWEEIKSDVPDSVYNKIETKKQIFSSQPTIPYYKGDLWVQGSNGDILYCNITKETGTYDSSDWVVASKYTDDTVANNALEIATQAVSDNILTPSEKRDLLKELNNIKETYSKYLSICEIKNIDCMQYTQVYNLLINYTLGESSTCKIDVVYQTTTITSQQSILFRNYFTSYYSLEASILKSIQDATDKDVSNAQNAADKAQEDATEALGLLNDIASDNKITPVEKLQLKEKYSEITSSYNKLLEKYPIKDYYGKVSEFTGLKATYDVLAELFNVILNDMNETYDFTSGTYTREMFLGRIKDYYSSYQSFVNYIDTELENSISDVKSIANEAQSLGSELKKCLGFSTEISSDYVISPYIGGGYLNMTGTSGKVIIDPSQISNSTHIFSVYNSSDNLVMGVDVSGNGVFNGTITANSGKIGGCNIDGGRIYMSDTGISSHYVYYAFWAGETNESNGNMASDAKFKVTHSGKLIATEAEINGTITTTNGTIGGFTIDGNSIFNGTWGTDDSVMMCRGSVTSKSIGGSSSINGWCFTAGSKFGVTKNGDLYAKDVNLSGNISASTGNIGAFDIDVSNQSYRGFLKADVSANGKIYRTFIQPGTGDETWAFSAQISTDGGSSFRGKAFITADGCMALGGDVFDDTSVLTCNGKITCYDTLEIKPSGIVSNIILHNQYDRKVYLRYDENMVFNIMAHTSSGFDMAAAVQINMYNGFIHSTGGFSTPGTKIFNDGTYTTIDNLASGYTDITTGYAVRSVKRGRDGYMPMHASAFVNQSSKRYKIEKGHMEDTDANRLLELSIVKFDYINGDKNQYGLYAEDTYKVIPECVFKNENDVVDGVDYTKLIPFMIKKIQMQEKEIKELRHLIKNNN